MLAYESLFEHDEHLCVTLNDFIMICLKCIIASQGIGELKVTLSVYLINSENAHTSICDRLLKPLHA